MNPKGKQFPELKVINRTERDIPGDRLTDEMLMAALERIERDTRLHPELVYVGTMKDAIRVREMFPHAIISMPLRVFREFKAARPSDTKLEKWPGYAETGDDE